MQSEMHVAYLKFYLKRLHGHSRNRYTKALRLGEITRGDECEMCGSKEHIEGHHDDYAHPLAVRWLCRACHQGKVHRNRELPFDRDELKQRITRLLDAFEVDFVEDGTTTFPYLCQRVIS